MAVLHYEQYAADLSNVKRLDGKIITIEDSLISIEVTKKMLI